MSNHETAAYCQDCDEVVKIKSDGSGVWFCRECGFGITCQECGLPMYARHDCAEATARWS